MTVTAVPLSDDRLDQLRTLAARAGVTPEEFLARRVDQLLGDPAAPFRDAADDILTKNADLYRRLA